MVQAPAHELELAPYDLGGGVEIAVEPPRTPVDLGRWMRGVLGRATTTDESVRVLGSLRGTSLVGWPIEVVDAVVMRARIVVEHRLIAMYELLGHRAAVTARVASTPLYTRLWQSTLLPLVASARPRWCDRAPAALVEQWSLALTPPSD